MTDEQYMRLALDQAQKAATNGEVPVGAVVVDEAGTIVAEAANAPITMSDPSAHAEMLALRAAARRIGNYRLTGMRLYVTLEPCVMCAGAISLARLSEVVFAATDPKGGALLHGPRFFEQPTCHWRPQVRQGPFEAEAAQLLRDFFRERRLDSKKQ